MIDELDGKWSREIDEKNRLVYCIFDDGKIEIYQCKGHYGDK
jgi:Txe/YoeB family toxin of Txe-Axe toxin-antitoxin module